MKILIAGSDLNAKLTAQLIKIQNKEHDIYLTAEESSQGGVYTAINIKENDIQGLCDFVKYNQIEFTIVTSELSIINGIATEFKKEGFVIFAPSAEAARITFFNSIAKKIMYKLKINTPRFGIFDRENVAIEYIRQTKFPIIIENDFTLFSHNSKKFKTFSKAKTEIQKIFESGNNKIVIENDIDEIPINIYFITDGYNAMPLISLEKEENKSISAPSDKITENMLINILKKIIYPLLDDISKYTDQYCGILGLKLKYKNKNIFISEFYNQFQGHDIQAFLSLINDDWVQILYSTAEGRLADNYNKIQLKDKYSYTLVTDKKLIENDENFDDNIFIESQTNNQYAYTISAPTLNKAKSLLNEEEKEIKI